VLCRHVKKQLWGGEFWSDGYFVGTVGKHGDEEYEDYLIGKTALLMISGASLMVSGARLAFMPPVIMMSFPKCR